MNQFEICANGVESVIAARDGGATRVELCAGIPEGGTTPSYGEIQQTLEQKGHLKVHVIIRPRGGDFTYSPLELRRMSYDIEVAKELGVDGVVFGCLDAEGNVDFEANRLLLRHCHGLSVTFHRAFDRAAKPFDALEQLIDLGFDRILTSGQQSTAELGIPLLHDLQQQTRGRITLMAGCGVNETNIRRIHEQTGITEFHFSAREAFHSKVSYMNAGVAMGKADVDESLLMYTTKQRVENTIKAIEQ